MIGMKPVEAITIKTVPQPGASPRLSWGESVGGLAAAESIDDLPQEEPIEFGTLVRYLYQPGEVAGDNIRRATDPIWSVDVYEIYEINNTNPPLYTLATTNGYPLLNRTFTREQLQIIPPDTNFNTVHPAV